MSNPLAALVPFGKRYAWPAIGLVATVVSVVLLLTWEEAPQGLTIIATVGPPLTALALAVAAVGREVSRRRMLRAFVLGATLIPVIVLTIYGLAAGIVFALAEPLADAGFSLLDELQVDPTVVAVLSSPWAIVFLIELAVLAPLVEESLKPVAARMSRPEARGHAFLLGAAAGAGFAVIENILYASGSFFGLDDLWLPVSVLRSSGAALHLLGAGMIAVAMFEFRNGKRDFGGVLRLWGVALGIHAFWNGSIAVTVVLYYEQAQLGLPGSGLGWGTALEVLLGSFGMLLMAAIVVAARWAAPPQPPDMTRMLRSGQPAMVAGWAGLGLLMVVPAVIMILVFPNFLSL